MSPKTNHRSERILFGTVHEAARRVYRFCARIRQYSYTLLNPDEAAK
jgi:hypothetical protein